MMLAGKVALVTGAGSGIGAATARELATQGAHVGVLDVDLDAAQAVVDEIAVGGGEAAAFACDVRRGDACGHTVAAVAERFGGLDVALDPHVERQSGNRARRRHVDSFAVAPPSTR